MLKTKEGYERGLDGVSVLASRKKYGSNKITRKAGKSFIAQFAENLGDPIIKVLLGALVLNIIFTFSHIDWLETCGIAIAVLTATLISTVSERSSQAAFRRLGEQEAPTATVRRDGKIVSIPASDIVLGDVVMLSAGDKLAADGILISGSLFVDQSAMTGESAEAQKSPMELQREAVRYERGEFFFSSPLDEVSPASPHALFRGCLVSSGEGEMLVTAVGDGSFFGEIFSEIQLSPRESPLKIRLSRLAKQISRLGYAAAILVAFASLFSSVVIQSGFSREVIASKLGDASFMISEGIHALTLALTVIIMAVPEGLPMMIAVVLSSNVKKMAKDNVLVRKSVGIEAAGSMNLLFCDKTGTLTCGALTVEGVFGGFCNGVIGISELKRSYSAVFDEYCANAHYNSSSKISGGRAVGGNATERALLRGALAWRQPASVRLGEKLTFDSKNKYSFAEADKKRYIKGAPEVLLPHVTAMLDKDGIEREFDRYAFERLLSEQTKKGKRVLLVAISQRTRGEALSSMCLVCAVVLGDRLRKEAADSVHKLRRAGVGVIMITGDNAETASAIARECGILGAGRDVCIESSRLARMSDAEISAALDKIGVIARALPSDKSRLVRIAQERGLVVGMTGDGINDAPALRRADVGFAMGNGTDVAKEAGDVIILDSDLASIVKAVLYGRNVFKSIRKFLVFQLTMNFAAVGVSMIAPFFGFDTPITVVQMLWVNMIMDTLGGLAFAGEAPSMRCMSEKPKRRDEPILNRYMAHQIFFSGAFSVLVSMLFLKHSAFTAHFREAEDGRVLLGAFFALFIFLGVMQCFNSRTDRIDLFVGISKNPAFLLIMCAISVIQITFVYLGGDVLRSSPLEAHELGFTLACAAAAIPAELVRKAAWRLSGHTTGF